MSILAVDGVSISFGGVHALDAVSATFVLARLSVLSGPTAPARRRSSTSSAASTDPMRANPSSGSA